MDIGTIKGIFDVLRKYDIFIIGNGKHFNNITYPFLCKSGLLDRVCGFLELDKTSKSSSNDEIVIKQRAFKTYSKADFVDNPSNKKLILLAVTGYKEILGQLQRDNNLPRRIQVTQGIQATQGIQVAQGIKATQGIQAAQVIQATQKNQAIKAIPSIYLESLYDDYLMLDVAKPPKNFRKHAQKQIPGTIHTFWFSGEAIPQAYERCRKSWEKFAPDMEVKVWTLENYKADGCRYFQEAIERGKWAFAADYARADVLRRYGGVYMDMDVEMLGPIEDLLYNDAYMSFESLDRIEAGSGIGTKPGNKILDEICKSYESRGFVKADGSLDMSTCPVQYTKVIEKHGLVKNGGFQMVDDMTIYPFEVLTGKSFDTGLIYRTDLSLTTHHHHGSWVPDRAKDAMDERYKEIEDFLRGV